MVRSARMQVRIMSRRTMCALICLWALGLCAANARAQIPCKYEIAILPDPPPCSWHREFIPSGISPNGRWVCGRTGQCGPTYDEALVVDTQTMQLTMIPRPSGVYSAWCNDINDAGMAVGGCWRTNAGMRGFMYQMPNGPWTELGPVDPTNLQGWCVINGINSQGVVCGTRSIGSQNNPVNPQTAFIWSASAGFIDAGVVDGVSTYGRAINESNIVAGGTGNGIGAVGQHAIIFDGKQITVLPPIPGGYSSAAWGLNSTNTVVGKGRIPSDGDPNFRFRGFIYASGEMLVVPPFSGYDHSIVVGISGDEIALVSCTALKGAMPNGAFIWHFGVLRDLNEMIGPKSGVYVWGPRAINGDGLIIADAMPAPGQGAGVLLKPIGTVGDATGDCLVNVSDLLRVINDWGKSRSPADFNDDGTVNIYDLYIVIKNWTS